MTPYLDNSKSMLIQGHCLQKEKPVGPPSFKQMGLKKAARPGQKIAGFSADSDDD